MIKYRRLNCTIHESDTPGHYLIKSTLVDGTPFEIKTTWDNVVFKSQEKNVPAEGFVKVKEFGIQENRATIELPSPSIVHGRKVCVDTAKLL
jgi:hypothetical protein